jgi:ribosomal protein L44E
MSEHYTLLTVSASAWCPKCQKRTQHRVEHNRKGPCLDCIERLERERAERRIEEAECERQKELFA